MKKKSGKKGKGYWWGAILALVLLVPGLAQAEFSMKWGDPSVHKGLGVAKNGSSDALTGSVVLGSIWSYGDNFVVKIKNEAGQEIDTVKRQRWVQLGVVDLGVGTRFGDDNETEGKKYTTHIGPFTGGCVYQIVCASYVFALQNETGHNRGRVNMVVDLIELANLASFNDLPGILGDVFK